MAPPARRRQRRQDGDWLHHIVEQQHQQRIVCSRCRWPWRWRSRQKICPMILASPSSTVRTPSRQVLHRRQVVHLVHRIAQRHRAAVGADGDVAAAVVAVDLRRAGAEADVRHVLQRRGPAREGTCSRRVWSMLVRAASVSRTRIGTCRSGGFGFDRFMVMSPLVAMRVAWLMAAVVTPSSAARSALRPDHQLRLLQAGAGGDAGEARCRAHLAFDVGRGAGRGRRSRRR